MMKHETMREGTMRHGIMRHWTVVAGVPRQKVSPNHIPVKGPIHKYAKYWHTFEAEEDPKARQDRSERNL